MIPKTLTETTLILCEGKGDEQFLKHLLENRNITGFQIAFPEARKDDDGNIIAGGYGRGSFWYELDALKLVRGFESLKNVVIVTDSDNDSAIAFREVQDQVTRAGDYDVPAALMQPSNGRRNNPPITVKTIPGENEPGNLETLVLRAVPDYFGVELACLAHYEQCTGSVAGWTIGKQSKMRLQCVVSAVCANDPTCGMSNLWSNTNRVFRPMLGHACFTPLVDFLRGVILA
jgi:5S rRNA maturation endonuclease (ribonuclease M5)